jgi:hypothetical protein
LSAREKGSEADAVAALFNGAKGDVTPKQFAIASFFSKSSKTSKTFKNPAPLYPHLHNSHISKHFQKPLNQLKT